MIEEHSKLFGFSSAHRWSNCHGSVALCLNEPNPDSPSSMEGTAVHWVGEQLLLAFKDDLVTPDPMTYVGQTAPNGVVVTEDMVDAATVYYKAVTSVVMSDIDRKKHLCIEMRVHAQSIDKEAWGTGDAIFYDKKTNTLHVWDLKYGHRSVDAYFNEQLVGYAQGYMESTNMTGNARVSLNIVQPRCYDGKGAVRNWTTTQLHPEFKAIVAKMQDACATHNKGTAMLQSGAHCRDCLAMYKCPAILQAGSATIDYSCSPIPTEMTADAISYEATLITAAIARLTQRQTAINAVMEARIIAGEFVPGYIMEARYGRDKWDRSVKEMQMFAEMMGVNLTAPTTLITPGQAKTILKKKGIDGSVIEVYYSKPKSGMKLVPDDGYQSRNIFSGGKL